MDGRTTRRSVLLAGGVVASGLSGCVGARTDRSIGFAEGFEGDLSGWETGSDLPDDPNTGGKVAWSIGRSTERAGEGSASLRLSLDGRQDDGTIWVQRPIEVTEGRAYEASARVSAWSPSESFNTIAHLVMYLGPDPPRGEGSFPGPGENSADADLGIGGLREPLNQVEGWRPYSFSWSTPELATSRLYLAVGISAVWETEMTYFVDDLKATLVPK